MVEGGGKFQDQVPGREEVMGHLTQPSTGYIVSNSTASSPKLGHPQTLGGEAHGRGCKSHMRPLTRGSEAHDRGFMSGEIGYVDAKQCYCV